MEKLKKMSESILTSFGTKLKPININAELFRLNNDKEILLDSDIENEVGTKKLFKKGSVIEATIWEEVHKEGKRRQVAMVQEGDNGRYLMPIANISPTTKESIKDKEEVKKELDELKEKVEAVVEDAKKEADDILANNPKGFLEKDFMGFKGKQILVASLGVIILIKLFK